VILIRVAKSITSMFFLYSSHCLRCEIKRIYVVKIWHNTCIIQLAYVLISLELKNNIQKKAVLECFLKGKAFLGWVGGGAKQLFFKVSQLKKFHAIFMTHQICINVLHFHTRGKRFGFPTYSTGARLKLFKRNRSLCVIPNILQFQFSYLQYTACIVRAPL